MIKLKLFVLPVGIILLTISLLFYSHTSNEPQLYHVQIDIHDQEKLQRGAGFFMNYCSGCHALRYLRYNQMGKDLGLLTFDGDLDEDLLYSNLVFTEAHIQDPVTIAMPETDAKQWFGVVPPDLSLTARQRGTDWIYTYLKSFYADPKRPFGTNNLLIPQVAMPNILEPLAGHVIAVKNTDNPNQALRLVKLVDGKMSEEALDSALEDLVTFLAYTGEPAKLVRNKIGYFVILYLFILFIVVYKLKKLYWKRIK